MNDERSPDELREYYAGLIMATWAAPMPRGIGEPVIKEAFDLAEAMVVEAMKRRHPDTGEKPSKEAIQHASEAGIWCHQCILKNENVPSAWIRPFPYPTQICEQCFVEVVKAARYRSEIKDWKPFRNRI